MLGILCQKFGAPCMRFDKSRHAANPKHVPGSHSHAVGPRLCDRFTDIRELHLHPARACINTEYSGFKSSRVSEASDLSKSLAPPLDASRIYILHLQLGNQAGHLLIRRRNGRGDAAQLIGQPGRLGGIHIILTCRHMGSSCLTVPSVGFGL